MTGGFLAQTDVQAHELAGNNAWSRISLPITVTDTNNRLEFRGYRHGTANLHVAALRISIRVTKIRALATCVCHATTSRCSWSEATPSNK